MAVSENRRQASQPVEQSILAARESPNSALGQLLDLYRDYLLRIAHEELASDLAAKAAPSDVVQETFLQAARDFPRFAGTTEAELRGWLRQILLHNLRDAEKRWFRTQMRAGCEVPLAEVIEAGVHDLAAKGPTPSRLVATSEDCERVHQAMLRLPVEHRMVIELRTFQEKSFEEVGREMSRSSEAARKLWSRAIEQLALVLEAV